MDDYLIAFLWMKGNTMYLFLILVFSLLFINITVNFMDGSSDFCFSLLTFVLRMRWWESSIPKE